MSQVIAEETLRAIRDKLKISMREAEVHSRKIANKEGNGEYYISNTWLGQIKKKVDTRISQLSGT